MPESRGIREDSSVAAASRRVEVALLAGRRAPQTLIYAVPHHLASDVRAGTAVIAPLGPRQVTGVVLGPTTAEPPGRLRELTEVLHQALPRELLELALWAARYYRASRTALLQAALPQALRHSRRRRVVPVASDASDSSALRHPLDRAILARLPADGLALETLRGEIGAGVDGALRRLRARGWLRVEDVAIARREPRHPVVTGDPTREPAPRARKQCEIHAFVSTRAPHPVPREELEGRFPGSGAVVARMLAAGALRAVPAAAVEAPAAGPPFPLHPEQEAAVEAIDAARGSFTPFLLHGATGSGKTEVYLEAAARAHRRGAGVLVLVPEIGLTPQLVEHARRRFGNRTQVLHSGLPEGERAQAWREVAATDGAVVIGARSAVFAPVRALGLVVVDEEHDSAYKQEESPRYHARDVAVMRARRLAIPIMLGSATPSLETLHNVAGGRYGQLLLPERARAASEPTIRLVDLRTVPAPGGLSAPLLEAMRRHLANGAQVLVFLNRRGYAPSWFCSRCGWSAQCARCDARLTYHRSDDRLHCHHCGAERAAPAVCPSCAESTRPAGQGTERITESLAACFPDAAIARIDRDSTRRRGSMQSLLAGVKAGTTRILVGTQMLTKGHDFPEVAMVGVLNADQGLFGTDFRSAERLAQILVQVAGRAGRAERPGEVYIQSAYPEHPLLQRLIREGYASFARAALDERRSAGWPPFSALAVLRAEAADARRPPAFLERAAQTMRELGRNVTVLGPAPATMARRAGRHRAQIVLQTERRAELQRALAEWLPTLDALPEARRVRWAIDVDPLEL